MTSSPSFTPSVIGTERETRLVGFALLLAPELLPRRSRLLLWLRPPRAVRSFKPRSLRSRPLLASGRASRALPFRRAAGAPLGRAMGAPLGRAAAGTGATTAAATAGVAPSASSRPAPPRRRRRRRR